MEQRRSARSDVSIDAAYRPRQGTKLNVSVVDLTPHGACIDAGFLLPPGTEGWLRLPGLSAWMARIIWNRDGRYGLAFDTPLHGAVLESLLHRMQSGLGQASWSEYADRRVVRRHAGSRRDQILGPGGRHGIAQVGTWLRAACDPIGSARSLLRKASEFTSHGYHDRHCRPGTVAKIDMRGKRSDALILNVSDAGLAVQSPVRPYIGEAVSIRLKSRSVIKGNVAWCKDGRFGVCSSSKLAEVQA